MEQQPNYTHQPEPEEDEERWLNEGGHVAPADEPPESDADLTPNHNDSASDSDI